jgi:hypothetical protein
MQLISSRIFDEYIVCILIYIYIFWFLQSHNSNDTNTPSTIEDILNVSNCVLYNIIVLSTSLSIVLRDVCSLYDYRKWPLVFHSCRTLRKRQGSRLSIPSTPPMERWNHSKGWAPKVSTCKYYSINIYIFVRDLSLRLSTKTGIAVMILHVVTTILRSTRRYVSWKT